MFAVKHQPQNRIPPIHLQANPQFAVRTLTRQAVHKRDGGVAPILGRFALELQTRRSVLQIITIATLTHCHQRIAKIHLQTRHFVSLPLHLEVHLEALGKSDVATGKSPTLCDQFTLGKVPPAVFLIHAWPFDRIVWTRVHKLRRVNAEVHRGQMTTLNAQLAQHGRFRQHLVSVHFKNRARDHIAIDQFNPSRWHLRLLRDSIKLDLFDHRTA